MTRHSQNELRYKQMYLINKFEKEIIENSLSKVGTKIPTNIPLFEIIEILFDFPGDPHNWEVI